VPRRDEELWARVREDAWRQAGRLTAEFRWEDLPLPLARFAGQVGVRKVFFRRFSVDGQLEVREDGGFDLRLHPLKGNARLLRQEYLQRDGRRLHPRIRFTIAHEIAHALFFARRDGEVATELYEPRSRKDEVRVERECNRIAAALLMPEHLVRHARESLAADSTEPSAILALTLAFGVSPEALILRLGELRWLTGSSAGVLLVVGKDPKLESWMPGTERICGDLEKGMPLRSLFHDDRLRLFAGDRDDALVRVAIASELARLTGREVQRTLRVRSCLRGDTGQRRYVVAIELVGEREGATTEPGSLFPTFRS
jgi:hypothetical protein